MIKFNLEFTTSKLMAYLIFIWLFLTSLGLIIIKKPDPIITIAGIAIGAIVTIVSVKNITGRKVTS